MTIADLIGPLQCPNGCFGDAGKNILEGPVWSRPPWYRSGRFSLRWNCTS